MPTRLLGSLIVSSPAAPAAVADAIARLQAEGAEAITILCTAIVGMAARLQDLSEVPLYDGLCALQPCLDQIQQPTATPPRPATPVGPSQNLSPALMRFLSGDLFPPV